MGGEMDIEMDMDCIVYHAYLYCIGIPDPQRESIALEVMVQYGLPRT